MTEQKFWDMVDYIDKYSVAPCFETYLAPELNAYLAEIRVWDYDLKYVSWDQIFETFIGMIQRSKAPRRK